MRQQANLSIKGMDFTAQEGFPSRVSLRAEKKKIIGKARLASLLSSSPSSRSVYFPRGESMEAVGEGQHS